MRYLGVDLHSTNFTVCFLADDGTHTFEKYPLKELEAFKGILRPDDYIAAEATGNSRFFHEQVSPLVAECVVVNTRQFKVIKQSVSKTDRNDARAGSVPQQGAAAPVADEGRDARAGQQPGEHP